MAEVTGEPVLGKRVRDEENADSESKDVTMGDTQHGDDDSDSDEVGPMPAPQGVPKKKRKGMYVPLEPGNWEVELIPYFIA